MTDNIVKEVDFLRKQNKQFQSERDVAINKFNGGKDIGEEHEGQQKRKCPRNIVLSAARR